MKRTHLSSWITWWAALVIACFSMACGTAQAAQKKKQKQAQAAGYEVLTAKETQKKIKELSPKYKEWLTWKEPKLWPTITEDEKNVFLQLKHDYERETFILKFWKRRSYDAHGRYTNFQEIYEAREVYAKKMSLKPYSDMAGVILAFGPPNGYPHPVKKIDCPDHVPIQLWHYERIDKLRANDVALIFYCPSLGGSSCSLAEMKLWPLYGEQVLASNTVVQNRFDANYSGERSEIGGCSEVLELRNAMASSAKALGQAGERAEQALVRPQVSKEALHRDLRMRTNPDPLAMKLTISKVVGPVYSPHLRNPSI